MSLFDDASLVLTPNGYKASKLYSIKPTSGLGDMTVVRATTATRVNSAGLIESVAINVPRLDYTGGGCPRILVEPLRTNLLLRSEEFDNAYWAKASTTITSNNTTAPDGNTTADRLVLTGTSSTSRAIARNVPITTVTTTVTFSTFVKYIDKQYLQLTFGSGFSSNFANFDLINGTVVGGTYGNAKIENYSNGWYRISITSTGLSTITCTAFIWAINSAAALRAADSTSTGTSAYWIWGAQLEDGSNATSYIPTVAATVTRNADVISQTGISSLIGQTEGTIYAEINNTLMTSYSTGYVMRIFADANNEVWIRKESATNTYTARWRANSVDVYTQSTISVLNGNNKIAIAYKSTDSAVYLNGSQIGTSASTGAFSVAPSQIGIGSSSTADFFNDRIELATLFPTRLTNAQ